MSSARQIGFLALLIGASALAQGTETPITLDPTLLQVLWIATCAGLVLMMQPGFALLESGMARAKNSVNVIMKNFTDCAISSLGYWAVGYGLMFGANPSGFIGVSSFLSTPTDPLSGVNLLYQIFFAATTATIISGAVAERIRYIPYLVGTFFVVTLIYPVYGGWVWGGTAEAPAWLRGLGFLDTAGGAAVHMIGGFTALAAVMILGPRFGRFGRDGSLRNIPGHSLPLAALGAFLLWVGWLGFNGGATNPNFSDLGRILLNTHLGAAAGIVGTLLALSLQRRPILLTLMMNGALGGLVSVTAGAKYMDPPFAILTGLIAGVIVVYGGQLLHARRIDDVVDAVPVHGFCGFWGVVATGLFFSGDLFDPARVGIQLLGGAVAAVWAFGTGYLVFGLINRSLGLRAGTTHEQRGLDYSEHYELGYAEFMAARTHAEMPSAVKKEEAAH
ncbi:MAG: ammonium transporter [Meiothermus sp.]|nr:ammonium transporter [Meiothermus sp.]